jgi:tetratricopeptide (TPR) repeat protein
MPETDSLACDLDHQTWLKRQRLLNQFETAWQQRDPPALADYLPADGVEDDLLLAELIHLDLEYRIKAGDAARVEEYLERFPTLTQDRPAVIDLIVAERKFRGRVETDLAWEDYWRRFPEYREELLGLAFRAASAATSQLSAWSCPDCGHALPAPAEALPARVTCSECGTVVRLESTGPCLTQLGKYQLEEVIGRGAFGIVYRARDTELDRTVAVKVPRPGSFPAGEETDRFLREARNAAKLRHPQIVTLHDAGRHGGTCFLVSEFVPGKTLADYAAEARPAFPVIAELIAQVALALTYAHEQGIVHRDVKPSNILIDAAGKPHLLDFGLAKREASDRSLTQEGQVLGTPVYMSPEQAQEGGRVDARSDVYSLGVVLYELLTGDVPFRGNIRMVLKQVLEEEPRPPRRINDRIPRDLETICLKALAKQPSRRYQTATELADDLHRWLRREPIRARPAGRIERLARWCRRKPVIAGLTFSLGFAVLAGSAGVLWQWRRAEVKAAEALAKANEAHAQFLRARATVDQYLTQVSEDPELKARNLEPLRRKLLQRARDYYEDFVREHSGDPDLEAELGRTYGRLGIIAAVLDSPPRSIPLFEKKRAVFERLHAEHSEDSAYQSELAESYWRLGYAYHDAGQWPQAWDALQQARQLWEELVRKYPDDPEHAARLIRTFNSLARSYTIAGRFQEAERVFLDGRAAHARWGEGRPVASDARYQESRAWLLANLGSLYRVTGRLEEGREFLQSAVGLGEGLVKAHPKETVYTEALYHALVELGWVDYERAQTDAAEQAWQRALQVTEELVRDHPANGDYQSCTADVSLCLGILWYEFRNRPADAQRVYQKALAIMERLVEEEPQVWSYWANLAGTARRLANLLQETGQWPAALELSTRMINQWKSAFRPKHLDDQVKGSLGQLYVDRADTLNCQKRYAEALQDYDRAIHLGPTLVPDVQHLRALTEGHLLVEKGEHARAAETAQAVAADAAVQGRTLLLAAELLGRCAATAGPEDERTEQYAARAVKLLRRAQSAGYFRPPLRVQQLKQDPELSPLRARSDFPELLSAVERPIMQSP